MEIYRSPRNLPVTGDFPSQMPVTRGFDVLFFICAWTNGWANNRDAVDLRRHGAHYDITVMNLINNLKFNIFNLRVVCLCNVMLWLTARYSETCL